MVVKLNGELLGGHVHVRVFTSKSLNSQFASAGKLVFSADEYPGFVEGMRRASDPGAFLVLVEGHLAPKVAPGV